MLSKENLLAALNRVEVNRGAPGVDGMTTAELRPWVAVHRPEVRAELEAGTCRPAPVRQVIIPKRGGGERILGVPGVLDRLIQQAIAQVLVPVAVVGDVVGDETEHAQRGDADDVLRWAAPNSRTPYP